jgi:hypothetical protein
VGAGLHLPPAVPKWEKDWPTLFGLGTGVPEGLLAHELLDAGVVPGVAGIGLAAFLAHFTAVWLSVWLVANGPLRVLSLRWRYTGGRVLLGEPCGPCRSPDRSGERPGSAAAGPRDAPTRQDAGVVHCSRT